MYSKAIAALETNLWTAKKKLENSGEWLLYVVNKKKKLYPFVSSYD